MFKQICIVSCERSETYRFETELTTKQILDVVIKLYLEKYIVHKDNNKDIFQIFYDAWDWNKLKENGIYPVKDPDKAILLWGWNTLQKYWEGETAEEDRYLIEGIKKGVEK